MLEIAVSINGFSSDEAQAENVENLKIVTKDVQYADIQFSIELHKQYAILAYRSMDLFEKVVKALPNGRKELRLGLRNALLKHGYNPVLGIRLILAFANKITDTIKAVEA